MQLICAGLVLTFLISVSNSADASAADALFDYGTNAYNSGDFAHAAGAFAQATALRPSSGALQNLGNAEWQRGQTGPAILAWEQALWLDPLNSSARDNLRFARRSAQLESPDLAWYEVVSSWLPPNWWAWLAAISLWSAVRASTVPAFVRWSKTAWPQS